MSAGLLVLLDDITALLDDVATMTKVAAKKTATLAGDDLAVGANQVNGVQPSREIPVVMKVFWGSMLNKLILVPVALLLSFFAPAVIPYLLIAGGIFLVFEGMEKVFHYFVPDEGDQEHKKAVVQAGRDSSIDIVALEKEKISGAIRTDLVLSAEIIIIALSTMLDKPLMHKILGLATIAILVTVVIYGCVALIVKIDDFGLYLRTKSSAFAKKAGSGIIAMAPWLMRALSVLGTLAMFSVGGSILAHEISFIKAYATAIPFATGMVYDMLVGVIGGAIAVAVFMMLKPIFKRFKK